jgi:integrase
MNIVQKINRQDLRRQLDSRQMETRRISFADLVKLYCLAKPPNHPRDARMKKWLGALGDLCAWDVAPDDCIGILEVLEDRNYAASTINREQTDIQAIYNWAIKNRRRTGCPVDFVNPLIARGKLKEQMRRVQLSDEKIDQMLTLAKASTYPRMYGLMLTAITSGGRKNELRRMRWSNTYLDQGTAEIGLDGKSGEFRTLLLAPQVVAELRTYQQQDPDALIFCRKHEWFDAYDERSEWRRIRKVIGRQDLHWHDLRHLATASLLRSGASLHTVSRVLGHKDSRMVSARYGSLEKTDLYNAVLAASGGVG